MCAPHTTLHITYERSTKIKCKRNLTEVFTLFNCKLHVVSQDFTAEYHMDIRKFRLLDKNSRLFANRQKIYTDWFRSLAQRLRTTVLDNWLHVPWAFFCVIPYQVIQSCCIYLTVSKIHEISQARTFCHFDFKALWIVSIGPVFAKLLLVEICSVPI